MPSVPRLRSPLGQALSDSEAQAFQPPEGSFLLFFLVDGDNGTLPVVPTLGRDGQFARQSVGHGDDFDEEEVEAGGVEEGGIGIGGIVGWQGRFERHWRSDVSQQGREEQEGRGHLLWRRRDTSGDTSGEGR